jgi:hypothetical protein
MQIEQCKTNQCGSARSVADLAVPNHKGPAKRITQSSRLTKPACVYSTECLGLKSQQCARNLRKHKLRDNAALLVGYQTSVSCQKEKTVHCCAEP